MAADGSVLAWTPSNMDTSHGGGEGDPSGGDNDFGRLPMGGLLHLPSPGTPRSPRRHAVPTALPNRPRPVSALEYDFVARVCNTVALFCTVMWLNAQLGFVETNGAALAAEAAPSEALRAALRAAGAPQVLPRSLSLWTNSDVRWWLTQNELPGAADWLSASGVDGPLLCHLRHAKDLDALGLVGSSAHLTRLLELIAELRQRLGSAEEECMPRSLDFWSYRQLHRKQVTLLTAATCNFPRATIAYLALAESSRRPHGSTGSLELWPLFQQATTRAHHMLSNHLSSCLGRLSCSLAGPAENTTCTATVPAANDQGLYGIEENHALEAGAATGSPLLYASFVLGSLLMPQCVFAIVATLFVDSGSAGADNNMWVAFAFITAMLGTMDQEHAALRYDV